MRHVRLLSLVLGAVTALLAITAANAFAEAPEITTSVPFTFTAKSKTEKNVLETAKSQISCKSSSSEGEITTAKGEGKGTIKFSGCTSKGLECESLAAKTKGVIEVSGVGINLTDIKVSGVLTLGILITLNSEVHIECGAGTLLILVAGKVLGTFPEVKSGTGVTSTALVFKQSAGKQEFTSCELPKALCEGKTYNLTANFGKGVEAAGEETEQSVTFSKETKVTF